MKKNATLLIQLLLIVLSTSGQNRYYISGNTKSHNDTFEIIQVDTIKDNMIVGNFGRSDLYCGERYEFDRYFKFTQSHYCCIYDSIIHNGQWLVENNNTIVLKSNNKLFRFNLFRLRGFYFLVPENQSPIFISDAREIFSALNNKKAFRKEVVYRKNWLLSLQLSFKYFKGTITEGT